MRKYRIHFRLITGEIVTFKGSEADAVETIKRLESLFAGNLCGAIEQDGLYLEPKSIVSFQLVKKWYYF